MSSSSHDLVPVGRWFPAGVWSFCAHPACSGVHSSELPYCVGYYSDRSSRTPKKLRVKKLPPATHSGPVLRRRPPVLPERRFSNPARMRRLSNLVFSARCVK